jgi:uncharacterized protein
VLDPVVWQSRKPCAICKKPVQAKFHPFCSQRCAQVDLNRWLGGNYAIPAVEAEIDEIPDEPA